MKRARFIEEQIAGIGTEGGRLQKITRVRELMAALTLACISCMEISAAVLMAALKSV
ncbi:MAG: hypothetical protein NVS9B5_33680 [Terriglobales bacterium]